VNGAGQVSIVAILVEFTAACGTSLLVPYLLYYRYIKGHLRETQLEASDPRRNTRVSLVICTLNEAESIEKKFEGVLSQSYPLERVEVLVVDGGSTDGTVETLRRIEEKVRSKLNVRVLENRAFRGKAAQLNRGFHAATGDIVITTDADVIMQENAIELLVDSLSMNGIGAVCGRQVLMNPDQSAATETEKAYRGFYEILRIGESNLHSTPIFHGGLSGYHRQAVSPISEDVNADDAQLALSVIRSGFRAIYERRCVFYAKAPSDLPSALLQRIRRGQGLQRVLWRNRDMVLGQGFGQFGFPILVAELYMHLVSPFLFVATITSFVALLAVLLLPFLALAMAVCVGLVILFYSGRRWFPIVFISSFMLYQAALFWAAILHFLGHNYGRWSTRA